MSFLSNLFHKKKDYSLDKEDIYLLDKNVYYYHRLPAEKKQIFEKQVATFLHKVPIYFKDTKPSKLVALLVASSAVIVTFGRPYSYDNNISNVSIVSGVLSNMGNAYTTGEVRHQNSLKTMVLSEQALLQGFKNLEDKHNVGIHEFVHILDASDGSIDGVPAVFMPRDLIKLWLDLAQKEMYNIKHHKSSIRAYGASNLKEFLTVCSEYFFERPKKLQKDFPDIYNILQVTFNQDLTAIDNSFDKKAFTYPKKIGRNDPCPCGSGKKYKHCCMQK